jgi:hypothetical protein
VPRLAQRPEASLAGRHPLPHASVMFTVSEAEAAAIRTAFEQGGEFSATVEPRRLFPGVAANAAARECAGTRRSSLRFATPSVSRPALTIPRAPAPEVPSAKPLLRKHAAGSPDLLRDGSANATRAGSLGREVTRLQIIGGRGRRRRAFILQQHDEQAESYSQDHD